VLVENVPAVIAYGRLGNVKPWLMHIGMNTSFCSSMIRKELTCVASIPSNMNLPTAICVIMIISRIPPSTRV